MISRMAKGRVIKNPMIAGARRLGRQMDMAGIIKQLSSVKALDNCCGDAGN